MFTGLVEALGRVERIEPDADGGRRLTIAAPFVRELKIGESVAVSGACLTVVAKADESFAVQAGPETLRKTTFGSLAVGDPVNLERSLQFGDRLGGHLVQGHVDGVGRIVRTHSQRRMGDGLVRGTGRTRRVRWCPRARWPSMA